MQPNTSILLRLRTNLGRAVRVIWIETSTKSNYSYPDCVIQLVCERPIIPLTAKDVQSKWHKNCTYRPRINSHPKQRGHKIAVHEHSSNTNNVSKYPLTSRRLSSKLLKQGYLVERLKSSFRKFCGRYGDLIWSLPLANVEWHSDPWPTVTSQPIRLFTNFYKWPLYQVWPLPNYERFPWSICNGCCMPAGNAYPSGHLVPPPFFTCLCSNCWDQIPRTCHVFTRLFTLISPWYFLHFAPL